MNERNQEALRDLLEEHFRHGVQRADWLAEWLVAKAGILVPSAMTEQDCADLFFEAEVEKPSKAEVANRLERIARDEPAQPGQPW
jgi:hypothetical protein